MLENQAATFPWDLEPKSGQPRLAMDFTYDELMARFRSWGLKAGNLDRFWRGLYKFGYRSATDFGPQTSLPKRLLIDIENGALPLSPFAETAPYPSRDGSVKYRFTLWGGGDIECVYMPHKGRITICVSSQVGCAMGCTFCATGKMGLVRQLSAGEIVGQVSEVMRHHPFPKGKRASLNVVFMGMGEPLHNLPQVMRAFDILTHPKGHAIYERDVAVSTSGLVKKIQQLAQYERRPQLMVSIAATHNEARSAVMPVNRAHPLEELMETLSNYPLRNREKIMLSYVLIQGVNDTPEDVDRLAGLSLKVPSMINLIPMNEHEGSPNMSEPGEDTIQWFTRQLLERGAFVTIRRSKGRDVAAACGQLVNQIEV